MLRLVILGCLLGVCLLRFKNAREISSRECSPKPRNSCMVLFLAIKSIYGPKWVIRVIGYLKTCQSWAYPGRARVPAARPGPFLAAPGSPPPVQGLSWPSQGPRRPSRAYPGRARVPAALPGFPGGLGEAGSAHVHPRGLLAPRRESVRL